MSKHISGGQSKVKWFIIVESEPKHYSILKKNIFLDVHIDTKKSYLGFQ